MHEYMGFSPKTVSILSMSSPFFDELWPIIFELADEDTQDALHLTHRYFMSMWNHCDILRKDARAKAEYHLMTRVSYPDDLKLACPAPLWYAWGAYKADISPRDFEEFCAIAGVDHMSGRELDDHSWLYLSRERDVTFTTANYPLTPCDYSNYIFTLGCTGEREKALQLEAWWLENGSCSETMRGTRAIHLTAMNEPNFLFFMT